MSDDPRVAALVERYLVILRRVVSTVLNLFNPSTIIIGGFLASVIDGVDPADIVGESIRSAREDVRVLTGSTDVDLLLVGAAELVFTELIAAPSAFMAGPRNAECCRGEHCPFVSPTIPVSTGISAISRRASVIDVEFGLAESALLWLMLATSTNGIGVAARSPARRHPSTTRR